MMKNPTLLWIKQRWRLLSVLLIPLIFLPLPIIQQSPQARCGYIVLILISYWIFEVIPLPVTSLLPLFLFPMAGVLQPALVAASYFDDIIALFFGSLSFAYAVESVNLHRRIALFVLSIVGTSVKWTMAGLMGVTAFLSMWINNSAATSIMLPVALAISDELERHTKNFLDKTQAIKEATSAVNDVLELTETEVPDGRTTKEVILGAFQIEEPKTEVVVEVKQRFSLSRRRQSHIKVVRPHQKRYEKVRKGFLLATAYSATIGGLASLVGTAPNVLVKSFVDTSYNNTGFRVQFLDFLLYALPVACKKDAETQEIQADLKAMLVGKYKELGRPNWSEYCVGFIFVLTVVLWITRDFGGTRGWDVLFQDKYVSDSTVAVFCGVLPLIMPNSNPFKSDWKYEPIVSWNVLVKHISWDAIFLLGAGISIASAFKKSGLSQTVADALKFLAHVPKTVVVLLVIIISALFTEVTSNLSTASIFFPVLDSVARSSGIHPAYLILPCTLAVSLAFMLPIATPPNAIVFSSGALRVVDMIKTGIVMNIIGFLVIFLAAMTWMPKIYNLTDEATEIFFQVNASTVATTMKIIG
ncbi:unnamed protein product [Adineta ricciae]|uniref:Uncharacterized protein n=1 Tax=Adineta ricciae TaxID=249248 RepID=A0A814KSJ0_ADIRI|nr:unnamed protein product [Adineta ricciae]